MEFGRRKGEFGRRKRDEGEKVRGREGEKSRKLEEQKM